MTKQCDCQNEKQCTHHEKCWLDYLKGLDKKILKENRREYKNSNPPWAWSPGPRIIINLSARLGPDSDEWRKAWEKAHNEM